MSESTPAFSDSDITAAIDHTCTEASIWELKLHQDSAIISFVKGIDVFVTLLTYKLRKSLINALSPSVFDCLRQKLTRKGGEALLVLMLGSSRSCLLRMERFQ